ncbi:MAG: hypothetical protein ACD_44C00308G0007 [uncultured bacterium]|nr:MAG: hypothetical protein ACD_44C00308G0007 [uncultured bacterium]OGT15313.1 MAG: 5-formyltetrahydrofolate cyclo-ligase [Gammaproteobacteria bacterium RIFCSPHIGHO2_02_FULL_38_33]OGT24396.1 MAG: 5-formyltetrahydrofolate cyclo-ligase [Gammaproteobacteria bacterium RIFCSPHIGHO2_12_38_15]OGT67987.1 MAG: 5-formyltetrahydrofolate cyclo-ligase [Gammaproteobacteria bacterium RIFCSPLOWO2_02_FULL_38_11]OGT76624.1 MAG: 5-formyltetrahydrofolate cyclo-ligase [Gammaproteobacteria bacterium RIFCSPLOWO2_12_
MKELPSKKLLRSRFRHHRQTLSPTQQRQCAIQITQHLYFHKLFKESQNIASYYAHQNEVETKGILEQAQQTKKIIYLPVLQNTTNTLLFSKYTPGEKLISNCYGIPEPENKNFIFSSKLELVLVPLLAFDMQGNRLGSGQGYYDRTFAFLKNDAECKKPVLVGLAYECQKVDCLPVEAWDIPLSYLVTEKKIYEF